MISILATQDTSYAVDLSIDIPFDLPRDAEVVGVPCLEIRLLRHAHVDNLVEKLPCIHITFSYSWLVRISPGSS